MLHYFSWKNGSATLCTPPHQLLRCKQTLIWHLHTLRLLLLAGLSYDPAASTKNVIKRIPSSSSSRFMMLLSTITNRTVSISHDQTGWHHHNVMIFGGFRQNGPVGTAPHSPASTPKSSQRASLHLSSLCIPSLSNNWLCSLSQELSGHPLGLLHSELSST